MTFETEAVTYQTEIESKAFFNAAVKERRPKSQIFLELGD
jgi:hypothetical protein